MNNKVKLVQLHEPLFLAGVNFGTKLLPRSGKGDLVLSHDSVSDHIIVNFNGEIAHIKHWASFNEDTNLVAAKAVRIESEQASVQAVRAQASGPGQGLKFNAQVETPHDKVQGRPGRKAKYQGEESQGE